MKQVKTSVVGMLVTATTIGITNIGQAQTPQPQSAPQPPPKSWADSVTIKGDIRYRYESINDDSKLNANKETYTRERDRIRARLNVEAKCNSNVKVGIGFATGQSNPISGNQTLGNGFDKKDFKLNLAYLDYNFMGDSSDELHVIAGKMKNPFIIFPDDLVWEGELTPEGIAVKSVFGESVKLLINGGYMWIQERSDKDDLMLYAGQSAVKLQFLPEIGLSAGISYYAYQNMQGYDVIDWESKNNSYGNSTQDGTIKKIGTETTTNKAWKYEYTPMVYFANLSLWLAGKPINIYMQELRNNDASKFNKGHMYGITLGKAKNPQTWELGYSYAELEKDATVGMFTDANRWDGGTDGKGHKLYAKYQFQKNLQTGITYFFDDKHISDSSKTKDYNRLQVNIVASF